MKTNKKSSNCYNYTTLLAQYPETKRLFRVWADEGAGDPEAIPSPEFDLDAAEQMADQVGEEILDTEIPEEQEAEPSDSLFDVEKIKENLTLALQAVTPEDIFDEDSSEYVLMVDSLGNMKSAREFLGLEQNADQDAILKAAQDAVAGLAEEAGLPGKFEVIIQEQEAEQPLSEEIAEEKVEEVESAEADGEEDKESVEEEKDEIAENTDLMTTFDVVYIFSDSDLTALEEAGYSFGQEAEASFEEIMSSLVEAGHRDTARRIYDILYPTKRH